MSRLSRRMVSMNGAHMSRLSRRMVSMSRALMSRLSRRAAIANFPPHALSSLSSSSCSCFNGTHPTTLSY